MAFHDGTSLDVATKVGDYNTLMYGQFSLATSMSSHSVTASLVKLNQYHSVSPVRSASTSRRQVYTAALHCSASFISLPRWAHNELLEREAVQWTRQQVSSTSIYFRDYRRACQQCPTVLVYTSCAVQQILHTVRRPIVLSSIAGLHGTYLYFHGVQCWLHAGRCNRVNRSLDRDEGGIFLKLNANVL